ncbi:MAG: hypothetical protein AAFP17_07650 [Pseudomonadota bacterium]
MGDFELALKLGLGRNLADIAPDILPSDQRYLKVLEALEAEGRLLDLRQALLHQGNRAQRADEIANAFKRVLGPPLPADFHDRDRVKRWLVAYDREVSVIFAARAALRVLPVLGRDEREKAPAALILPSLRAIAAPWLVGAWASEGADLFAVRAAARAAYATADAAAYTAGVGAARDAARVAARAAAAAAADVVADAADAAVADAVYADAAAISGGRTFAGLARRPLWADERTPPRLRDQWGALRARLLAREGEHWEVWTEWYEARLRGDPGKPALEYERVTSPKIDWEAGPAVVNAKIKEIIERHAGGSGSSLGELPEAKPAPAHFEFRDGAIRIEPSQGSDQLEDRVASVEAAWRALRDMLQDFLDAGGGGQDPRLARALDRTLASFSDEFETLNIVGVGVHAARLQQFAMRADEVLMPQDAAELVAVNAQLSIFLAQFTEWSDYQTSISDGFGAPEAEQEAVDQASEAIGELVDAAPELVSEEATAELEALKEEATPDIYADQPLASPMARRSYLRAARSFFRAYAAPALGAVSGSAREGVRKGISKHFEATTAAGLSSAQTWLIALATGLPSEFAWLAGVVTYVTRTLGPSGTEPKSKGKPPEDDQADI